MCGIAGCWSTDPARTGEHLAGRMADAIAHRGPDSRGTFADTRHGLALGHRRLAIVDLTVAGQQPMHSTDERYSLVYNGEIYNHLAVREALASAGGPVSWRGHSDTETLLAAVQHWGFEAALQQINGMFALALFDRHNGVLHLARDRLGEKPLYVGRFGNTVLFGSELEALAAHPAYERRVNPAALSLYLARSTVPAPHCMVQGVVKLGAGQCLSISAPDGPLPEARAYWSLAATAEAGVADPLPDDDEGLINRFEEALSSAVSSRLMADVPLGAFLSGGFDSSLVVALMQRASSTPVKTFTIGFREQGFDEAPFARHVASHLGTEHTELYLDAKAALDLIPKLPTFYDEPFADSSQIPTCLVAAMTRKAVTVSLSGDGGDELFAGYARYQDAARIANRLSRVPLPLRRGLSRLGGAAGSLSRSGAGRVAWMRSRLLRAEHLQGLIGAADTFDVFQHILTHWHGIEVLNNQPPIMPQEIAMPPLCSDLQRMMYHDMACYLPDTIMTKVDRASMSVSLEARAPLLDHELVELAWRLPDHARVRDGRGKWVLREVLYRHLPRSLMDRPKAGFGVPIDSWLRGPLRSWAEELLAADRLEEQGWFDVGIVRRAWAEHLSGDWDWHYPLWDVLMFQAWLEPA